MLVRGGGIRFACGERRLQKRKLLMGLQPPEAFGGLLHGGAHPAQSHRRRAPVFHVAADAPHRRCQGMVNVRGEG